MTSDTHISVEEAEGQQLNGLGMMMFQYLEQNLADFQYKVKEGLLIRCRVSVEVERGIAVTTTFLGERIILENGVSPDPDLYLKSSYLLLTKVLSGKANPLWELFKGNIKLGAWPRRPIQSLRVLRFLKIPTELLL
jgi:hypothetical protein